MTNKISFKAKIEVSLSLDENQLLIRKQIINSVKSTLDKTLSETFLREVFEETYIDDVLDANDLDKFKHLYDNSGFMGLEVSYDIKFEDDETTFTF